MDRITEYMKLVPKGLPNIDKVIEGIINNIELKCNFLSDEHKSEIIKRRIICETCPYNSENAKTSKEYVKLTGDNYISSRNKLHCSFCGCPIDIRTASLSANCGIEVWNEDTELKLNLKWGKYEAI